VFGDQHFELKHVREVENARIAEPFVLTHLVEQRMKEILKEHRLYFAWPGVLDSVALAKLLESLCVGVFVHQLQEGWKLGELLRACLWAPLADTH
jgi:hypothetical protein